MVSSARSSPRRPCMLLRTEPPPHRRPLLPSSPKPTGVRHSGVAFSIPRRAPIESDQSDESLSFHLANPFQSSRSTRLDWSVDHLRLMQLLCQRNSLNLRSFTAQEIADVSEILTVQKNEGTLITSSAEATQ